MLHRVRWTATTFALLGATFARAQSGPKPVAVHGVAYDGLRGQPLSSAQVTLVGGAQNTVTDSRGRFRFDSVMPGVHTFAMQHAALDSLGFSGLSTRATITTGRDEVRISVPSFTTLWRAACGGQPPADSGFVYGTIRDANDLRPVANAIVTATWVDVMLDKRRRAIQRLWRVEARSDSSGSYAICGVASAQWLRIHAGADSAQSGSVDLPPAERRVQRRDLLIGRSVDAHGYTISGMVADATGAAFADARVILDGGTEVRSGADGRFTIQATRPGTQQLEAVSIGIVPVTAVVDVVEGDTATVVINMGKPIQLDPMRVVGARTGHVLASAFDARRKAGTGYALDSTGLARYPTVYAALQSTPGTNAVISHGALTISMTSERGGTCTPEVRIDGMEAGFGHILDLQTNEVGGVEVYARPLTVPADFVHGGNPPTCGMILLWTKYGFRLR